MVLGAESVSAAGRCERLGGPHDYYATPSWCVDRLLEVWRPCPGLIVEPCAGDGAVIRAVEATLGRQRWVAMEIREDAIPTLKDSGADAGLSIAVCGDFLKNTVEEVLARAVITNPPYSLAAQFIEHCRLLYPGAEIAMLLRLPFLASEERLEFFERMGMPDVYVLPNRPSFRSKGTDSTDYAWMIWTPDNPWKDTARINLLRSTPLEERKRCKTM